MRRGRRGPHPPMRDGARRDPLKRAAAAPPAPALRIFIPLAPRASSGRARATRRHLRAPESTPRNSAAPSPTFGLTARASAPITRAVRRSCREPTASAARRPMPHANARAMCRSPGATANRLPDIVLPIPDRLDARMEPPKSATSPSATRHEHRSPRGCVARRRLFIPAGCRTIGEPFHEACALPSFTELPRLIQHDARRFCADALRFARALAPVRRVDPDITPHPPRRFRSRGFSAPAHSSLARIGPPESSNIGCFPDARMPAA